MDKLTNGNTELQLEERKQLPDTYRKLAQCYFPDAAPRTASQALQRWIKANPNLQLRLQHKGWRPKLRSVTPQMVHIIFEQFGTPFR